MACGKGPPTRTTDDSLMAPSGIAGGASVANVGATAIATVMLGFSFVLLLGINGLQAWSARNAPGTLHEMSEPVEEAVGA